MRASLSLRLKSISTWKLVVATILGAVLITDSLTGLVSLLIWGWIPPGLLVLGTLNAIVVPIVLAPILIRAVKKAANLEMLNRQLQQEAAERQQAQAERERLIKELEAKNAELERFTYTVSHDLKKFMGHQSDPRILIGSRTVDGENAFFVQDNGSGIDPQFHGKIFGLFNQLDPSMDGTGVGLALVKRIVEVHGGRIWVESAVGQGATFFFTLPAVPPLPK